MSFEFNYLIELSKTVLKNDVLTPPSTDLSWEAVYQLTDRHALHALVFAGIERLPKESQPEDQLYQQFKKASAKSFAKEAVQYIEGTKILDCFEKHGIACMPVKGWLVRQLYPHPALRSMADIDILVSEKQVKDVHNLMKQLGYQVEQFGVGVHDIYKKWPYMNIEIHRSLFTKSHPMYEFYQEIWGKSTLKEGYSYVHQMSKEDTLIYLLAHMNKHFSGGGTGIRSVMDIWIYLDKYGQNIDFNYINQILTDYQLADFSKQVVSIGQAWFSCQQDANYENEIEKFLVRSGVYGTQEILIARNFANLKGSLASKKVRYFFRRLLPPLNHMSILYPKLKQFPFLISYYWIRRMFHAVSKSRKRIGNEYIVMKGIDDRILQEICKINKKDI